MHNDGVNRRTLAPAALLATATLALAGCSGGGSSSSTTGAPGTGGTSKTGTATSGADGGSTSSTPAVTVQGVALTAPGTKLVLGKPAKVSWHPDQKTTGVMKVSVTKLQKVPMSTFKDWRLGPATQRSTPFFVHASVRNLGKSALSGVPVPLYLLDGRNTLLQPSTFRAHFPACPSTPLPPKFTRGKKASVCLVYFAPDHGKLTAISFRPSQEFEAITWTGPLAKSKQQ